MQNSDSSEAPKVLLSVKALNKSFAVPVLRNLDFELRQGEVHALMGSNGAGKSTLCNIIAGVHQPTSGGLALEGQGYSPKNIKAAEEAGVRMVMQELNLFPTLSIAENICFKSLTGKEKTPWSKIGLINSKGLDNQARQALSLLNLQHLNTRTSVSALGVGQQQLIEIASVIAEPVKLLILDEPTAALTDPQIDELFLQLNLLREQGVGIIYISHRMDEISRIADRVSILRDGELVATLKSSEADTDRIVSLMAGELEAKQPPTQPNQKVDTGSEFESESESESAVLKVENLGIQDSFENISFEIRAGEVLGIGGLIGSGRTEVLRALFGADKVNSGGLRFSADNFLERRTLGSPKEAIEAGIGMVVEDRKHLGLMMQSAITENISIGMLKTLSRQLGLIDKDTEMLMAKEIANKLDIKYHNLSQPISELSGGNQQKALIARWLLKDLPILLFDEPSRGVDARAKALIQDLIRELAARGKAIVVVSSETQELVELSDRILVMSNGKIAAEFDANSVSEEQLLEASFKFYSKTSSAETDTTNNQSTSNQSTGTQN